MITLAFCPHYLPPCSWWNICDPFVEKWLTNIKKFGILNQKQPLYQFLNLMSFKIQLFNLIMYFWYQFYQLGVRLCLLERKKNWPRRSVFTTTFMVINLCFAVVDIIANINTHYWFSSFSNDAQNDRNKPHNLAKNVKVL